MLRSRQRLLWWHHRHGMLLKTQGSAEPFNSFIMNITAINQNNFSKAVRLLEQNDLPTEDLSGATQLFVLEEGDEVLGTIALEHEGEDGLLRSLCVSEPNRKAGTGQQLVDFIEDHARKQGVQHLYLLTTTAAHFFGKRGYQRIDRSQVSPYIASSSEFSTVCPASATVMLKKL